VTRSRNEDSEPQDSGGSSAPLFRRVWRCEVFSSGYHNGARCRPEDPHGGWACEYRYVASSLPDTDETRALIERIEWLRQEVPDAV